jgi:tetratricopeptide (TPR) repeat protein
MHLADYTEKSWAERCGFLASPVAFSFRRLRVSRNKSRTALLNTLYREYLLGQQTADFIQRVTARYTVGTLERLARSTRRETRRAAVLALGLVADYSSNAVLGRALVDADRGVRTMAENGIVSLWRRAGNESHRQQLAALVRLNSAQHYHEAIEKATELIAAARHLAEAWNQRAIGYYGLGKYPESIRDCHEALELNPYHFAAASGMGQCYVQMGEYPLALESFRRALKLNPNLEGVRASVNYLERSLKGK